MITPPVKEKQSGVVGKVSAILAPIMGKALNAAGTVATATKVVVEKVTHRSSSQIFKQ